MISMFYIFTTIVPHGVMLTGGIASPETAAFKASQVAVHRVQGSGFRAQVFGLDPRPLTPDR
jgi:hypothetical protein